VSRRRPLVHLIDGPVYIFRAYHSLPSMSAPDGTPTNAAYGYANTLLKWAQLRQPSHVAIAFDHSQRSFRNEIEPGYKAQRGDPPDDLEPQFDICVEVSRALGFPVFSMRDFEADDLIATLAAQLLRRGAEVEVITTDKDLCQLVREDGRLVVYDLARDAVRDADGVREKFGVDPEQIPDYLGLVGDAVDNLPGVPGVGAKGAAAMLRAFGRIERVPAEAHRWAGVEVRGAARLASLVAEHRERALLTRQLATVRRDVPGVAATPRDLFWKGAVRDEVEPLFERLGWGRIATRIPRWADAWTADS
jgi:5'-3' exonuclease